MATQEPNQRVSARCRSIKTIPTKKFVTMKPASVLTRNSPSELCKIILLGPKSGRQGLLARLGMAQVTLKYKEVTTMSMIEKKSKKEGKEELREQPGACHHHLPVQEAQHHQLGPQ